jgi:hypothetical protein
MKQKIKFTVNAVRWFDKVNGNTYHSVSIIRHKDGKMIVGPMQYGYGDSYRQTSLELLAKNKWLPKKYCENENSLAWYYERENNYPILWFVSDSLKRDCIKNGIL